jgi:hypothetical protein
VAATVRLPAEATGATVNLQREATGATGRLRVGDTAAIVRLRAEAMVAGVIVLPRVADPTLRRVGDSVAAGAPTAAADTRPAVAVVIREEEGVTPVEAATAEGAESLDQLPSPPSPLPQGRGESPPDLARLNPIGNAAEIPRNTPDDSACYDL